MFKDLRKRLSLIYEMAENERWFWWLRGTVSASMLADPFSNTASILGKIFLFLQSSLLLMPSQRLVHISEGNEFISQQRVSQVDYITNLFPYELLVLSWIYVIISEGMGGARGMKLKTNK